MSNHRARTWDHRGSKPFDPKLLSLDHHLDGCKGLTLNSTFKCLYSPVPTTCTPVIDLLFVFPLTFWAHTPLFLPLSSCRLYTNKPQLDPIINEIKSWAQLLGLASRMVQFQVHPKWVVCCSLSQIRPTLSYP